MTRTLARRLLALTTTSAMLGGGALAVVAPAHAGADETCVGTVEVTDATSGESLGRIGSGFGLNSGIFVFPDEAFPDEATLVQVTPDAAVLAGGIGDLLVDDSSALGGNVGGDNSAPYEEMTPGTADNVFLNTGPAGTPTSATTELYGFASTFWGLDPDSGELTVEWTQPSGDILSMASYYDSRYKYAGAAADFADFAVFSSQAGGDAVPVTFTLIPNPGLEDVCPGPDPLTIAAEVTSDSPANEAGWYRTPATITYTCGGGTAPLTCPDPVTRSNTKPGTKVFRKVTDADGNTARARTPLQVDTTTPQLTIAGQGGGPFERDARPITCTATDTVSGVDGDCTVTYSKIMRGNGGNAIRRWTATATDIAGNTKTITRSMAVEGKAPQA